MVPSGRLLELFYQRLKLIVADVFEMVQSSRIDYGLVPFENSTHGVVEGTLDLFADRHGSYPNVTVSGESYFEVHHFLLGHASGTPVPPSPTNPVTATSIPGNPSSTIPLSKPLTSLSHIRHVYSHPQALGQCKRFLSTFLRHAEQHEVSSTSKAAQDVARGPPDCAAISSQGAATALHLDTLAEDVEDGEDNTTRFFSLQHKDQQLDLESDTSKACEWKALLSFEIDQQCPGALAKALMVFDAHQLNLTSINSRPSREVPWHYVFFVEFKSTGDQAGLVGQAMRELTQFTQRCRLHGRWVPR